MEQSYWYQYLVICIRSCVWKYYIECRADKDEDRNHGNVANVVADEEGGPRNHKMDERIVTEGSSSRPDGNGGGGNARMEGIDKKGEIALVEPE